MRLRKGGGGGGGETPQPPSVFGISFYRNDFSPLSQSLEQAKFLQTEISLVVIKYRCLLTEALKQVSKLKKKLNVRNAKNWYRFEVRQCMCEVTNRV